MVSLMKPNMQLLSTLLVTCQLLFPVFAVVAMYVRAHCPTSTASIVNDIMTGVNVHMYVHGAMICFAHDIV